MQRFLATPRFVTNNYTLVLKMACLDNPEDETEFYDNFNVFEHHEPYISYELEAELSKSDKKINAKSINITRILCTRDIPEFTYANVFSLALKVLPEHRKWTPAKKHKSLLCIDVSDSVPHSSALKLILRLLENNHDARRNMPLSIADIDHVQLSKLLSFVFGTLELRTAINKDAANLFLASVFTMKKSMRVAPWYRSLYLKKTTHPMFSTKEELALFWKARSEWWANQTLESLFPPAVADNVSNVVLCKMVPLHEIMAHAIHVFGSRNLDFPHHTKIGVFATTPYGHSQFLGNFPCAAKYHDFDTEDEVEFSGNVMVVSGAHFMGVGALQRAVKWAEGADRLLYLVGHTRSAPTMNLQYGKIKCVSDDTSTRVSSCVNVFDWMFDSELACMRMYPPHEESVTKELMSAIVDSNGGKVGGKKITLLSAPSLFNAQGFVTWGVAPMDIGEDVIVFTTRRIGRLEPLNVDVSVGDLVFDPMHECMCRIKKIWYKTNDRCNKTDFSVHAQELYFHEMEDGISSVGKQSFKAYPVHVVGKACPMHIQCNKQMPGSYGASKKMVLVINDHKLNLRDLQFALDLCNSELVLVARDFSSSNLFFY